MEIPRQHPDRTAPSPAEVEAVLRENERLVRVVYDAGRGAYPALPLPFDLFARRLVEIVHRRPMGELADTAPGNFMMRLSRVAGAEIYLAIACEEHVPGAWEAFQATHAEDLRRAAVRHRAPGTDSEEIAEGLIGDLFAPPAGGATRTRIGTWDGSGPLGAWLAAVLRNRFLDAKRSADGETRRREVRRRTPAPGAAERPEDDPALAAEAEEERARFEQRLKDAWEELTPSEMLALTLKFRDGRSQVDIAALLEVGEPRVSRIVASGIRKLRERMSAGPPGAALARLEGPWAPAPGRRPVLDPDPSA